MRALLASALLLALPASAQQPQPMMSPDEVAIRSVIAGWYDALQKKKLDPDTYVFHAPGFIDGGPAPTMLNPRSAARSPELSNELAAQALKFSYDVDVLKIDPRLAKAVVWERGYFYAPSPQATYEMAASATFVFEKQADGRWLILAHQAVSQGIPPNKVTRPMPDMRPLWDAQVDNKLNTSKANNKP